MRDVGPRGHGGGEDVGVGDRLPPKAGAAQHHVLEEHLHAREAVVQRRRLDGAAGAVGALVLALLAGPPRHLGGGGLTLLVRRVARPVQATAQDHLALEARVELHPRHRRQPRLVAHVDDAVRGAGEVARQGVRSARPARHATHGVAILLDVLRRHRMAVLLLVPNHARSLPRHAHHHVHGLRGVIVLVGVHRSRVRGVRGISLERRAGAIVRDVLVHGCLIGVRARKIRHRCRIQPVGSDPPLLEIVGGDQHRVGRVLEVWRGQRHLHIEVHLCGDHAIPPP
mmetsp:Transcript_20881/g.55954  ORF Transcript_20881/g.55954 Transcript_20881/m.55954 type:complete len:283 (+) Transcript_20881:4266-5114(+)